MSVFGVLASNCWFSCNEKICINSTINEAVCWFKKNTPE